MQRGTVGQIKLEPAEDFSLHSQQLMLSVGVVHQVAESRHLEAQKGNISLINMSLVYYIMTDLDITCYIFKKGKIHK